MALTVQEAKNTAERDLNSGWAGVKTEDQMKTLVKRILGQAYSAVSKKDHTQLYRQLSLILHPDKMKDEWKQRLLCNQIPVDMPFKQILAFKEMSLVEAATATHDFTYIGQLLAAGLILSFVNVNRYPQPFKFFAYLLMGTVALIAIISLFLAAAAMIMVTIMKDFFVNCLINIVTSDGLNREIEEYEHNYPEQFNEYKDTLLLSMKTVEISRLKLKLNFPIEQTEMEKVRTRLDKIEHISLDEYKAELSADQQEAYDDKLHALIKQSGFNYLIFSARAMWNSITKPLPDFWALKPLAVILRSIQSILYVGVVMPLVTANWIVNKTINVTSYFISAAIALATAAVNIVVNLPLLLKDGLAKLCSGAEDEEPSRPNPYRMFQLASDLATDQVPEEQQKAQSAVV